ncbi:MAG TPA: efflux RND transporter periplasmic adaptor subunit, partial [Pseudolabrys sp.]|nr:efflux RND transporter periplasmic adaptor subunit [Pseudolabrys sp.]
MMRKRLLMLVVALIVAGSIGLEARHVTYAAKPSHTAPAPTVPVIAGIVQSGDVPIYLRGVGTVIAYNNVVVRSQITGQIIKIAFTEGQTV